MTPLNQQHLTDDQFSEYLSGTRVSPATEAHVASCESCLAEVGLFLNSVDDFSAAAFDWSKSQPVISPRTKLSRQRHSMQTPLRWALATALLVAVSVPVIVHEEHGRSASGSSLDAQGGENPAQIAQDNNLLLSVNVALGTTDPSPFQEYGIANGPQNTNESSRPGSRPDSRSPSRIQSRNP